MSYGEALAHAARIAVPGEPVATTVERARAFHHFLTGDTDGAVTVRLTIDASDFADTIEAALGPSSEFATSLAALNERIEQVNSGIDGRIRDAVCGHKLVWL